MPFATAPPPLQPPWLSPSSATPVAAAMQQLSWQLPPATNPDASTMQQGQQLQPPPPATAALGIPTTGPGVPIHQVWFPPSPSPLPAWLAGSLEPVYTTASVRPHVLPLPATHPAMQFGGSSGYAEPFTSVDGPLFQGGTLMPAYSAPTSLLRRADEVHPPVVHVQTPPRFSKLEFATYDGTLDPLNWLNQCNQFFRGQRTLASNRT